MLTKLFGTVHMNSFKCPEPSQWNIRAKSICDNTKTYICLFDENRQRYAEFCGRASDFENPGYKQILLGGPTRKPCSEYKFQPFKFWTNGSSDCVYKKTSCNQEGQMIHNNGTLQTDRVCRCDYTKNYDFVYKPINGCFCMPSTEDCSCYRKPCPAGYRLTPEYDCLHKSKWKLSFSCPEINEDTIDVHDEMSTNTSTDRYTPTTDSVAWPSVIVTLLFITSVCAFIVSYLLRNYRNIFGECLILTCMCCSSKARHRQDVTSKSATIAEIQQPQNGKDEYNKKETACIIPNDVLDLQEKEIMKWRKRQYQFEVTNASNIVLNNVKTHGFVILSGPSGSGKSAIAYNTAFLLEKKQGFKILPVSSPEEIRKYLLPETKQIFLIDDVVGKYTVDYSSIQLWKNEETFIKQAFTDCSTTKLILTCRSYIYKSGFCGKLQILPIHCDLLSHNLKLSFIERTNICHRYNVPELNEDVIMMYDFLPFLCVGFSRQEYTTLCFENPIKFLREEMNNTKEKSDIAFLAIALLVVRDNIDKQILSLENPEIKELLNDLCNECGYRYFPSTALLLSALSDLIGTNVRDSIDGFACINNKLFQNLSFIVGSDIIHCLIKYASSTFLAKRLQLDSIQQDHDELTIMVKPEQEKLYFQRLISDIKNCYHRDVFTGIQMTYLRFRTKMIQYIKSLKADDLKCNGDNSTPLHIVSEQGYADLAYELIKIKEEHIYKQDNNKRTPLYLACFGGHSKVAQTLLVHNQDTLDITNNDDLTPLDAAAKAGHYTTVKLLLQYNANVKRKDKKMKRTALYRACENGRYDVVCLLMSQNPDVKYLDKKGLKAVHIACSKGHCEIVKRLLKHKDMINECDAYGRTPLFVACESNQQDIVDMLLKNKANVNQANKKTMTPLHVACQIKNEYIVGQLLNESAKVNAQSEDGLSALYIASCEGKLRIVEILLDKNAEVNLATKKGWTSFFISCSKGHLEISKVLQQRGAIINRGDKSASTPLHIACEERHEHIAKFLIVHNVNVNAVNKKKESPLYIACLNECLDIVELLLNNNADVNLCDGNENSPLHVVCLKGNKQIAQLLLDKQADIHRRNNTGKTPLDVVQHVQGREKDALVEMLNRLKKK
ncbi:unnamed protein product [Mytilus coruscus]|uniref:Novel STAND NTPase 3 domain-containing protein n=1 Tax=Mytilus coruscus TaxID=42192 RepID=A0A6J8BDJ7_MYTCO|nr:unnamed protein product [Mytilus coruscus]